MGRNKIPEKSYGRRKLARDGSREVDLLACCLKFNGLYPPVGTVRKKCPKKAR